MNLSNITTQSSKGKRNHPFSFPLPFQRSSDSNSPDYPYQSADLGSPVNQAPHAVISLRFFLITSTGHGLQCTQIAREGDGGKGVDIRKCKWPA